MIQTSLQIARLALSVALFLVMPVSAQDVPRGMMPVQPEVLLKILPESVEEWELIKSEGTQDQDDWLNSVAIRIFTRSRPESNPGPAMRTLIKVTDTGGYPPARALYTDFAPGAGNRFEKKYIQSFPAIVIEYGPEKFETELLVNDRFIVEILSENQPRKFTKEWLKRVRFREFARIEDGPIIDLPETVRVRKIDELNRNKSRSYEVALVSGAKMDEEAAADLAAAGDEVFDETDKAAAEPDPTEPEGSNGQ